MVVGGVGEAEGLRINTNKNTHNPCTTRIKIDLENSISQIICMKIEMKWNSKFKRAGYVWKHQYVLVSYTKYPLKHNM